MASESPRILPTVRVARSDRPRHAFDTSHCARYSADLTPDQKDALLDVIRATPHPQIGPEIRRELVNSVSRGDPRPEVDQDVEMS
jgi:hypothetical protein